MAEEPINPALALVREKEAEAQRQADLVRAYKLLFGEDPLKRTTDQELVWADLENQGYFKKSTVMSNSVGACDPFRVGVSEGRRTLFLYILSCVTHVATKAEQQQK